MLKVGLTGGIGSGKSSVCTIFRDWGVPVIDTDALARQVVEPGSKGLEQLVSHFGPTILQQDGSLDRTRLRRLVFTETEQRQHLEAILHPLIRARLHEKLIGLDAPYVIIAIPLLLEKGWQQEVDRILVVDCTTEQQVERVVSRDGSERKLINNIIETQATRHHRLAAADDIIHNDMDMSMLRAQVEHLHRHYSALATNA